MRSIFKNRKLVNATIPVDAQPRGIHHTVKIDENYNETWSHIWTEIKKIGISPRENTRFESKEIYSYGLKAPKENKESFSEVNCSKHQNKYCNRVEGVSIKCSTPCLSSVQNETVTENASTEDFYESKDENRPELCFAYESINESSNDVNESNTHQYDNSYYYHLTSTEEGIDDDPEERMPADTLRNHPDYYNSLLYSGTLNQASAFFFVSTEAPLYDYHDDTCTKPSDHPQKIEKNQVDASVKEAVKEKTPESTDSYNFCANNKATLSVQITDHKKLQNKRRKNEPRIPDLSHFISSSELNYPLNKNGNAIKAAMRIPKLSSKKQFGVLINEAC